MKAPYRIMKSALFYVFVFGVVLFWAFPIFWILISSFKPDNLIVSQDLHLIFGPTLAN